MSTARFAGWAVPLIVALTFGSIAGFCITALITLVVDQFAPHTALVFFTLFVMPAMAIGTMYQRIRTIPRLSKGNLTGTGCHCLALWALLGGQYLVVVNGAPPLTTLWLVIAGYAIGGLFHLWFRSCDWQPQVIRPHFARSR